MQISLLWKFSNHGTSRSSMFACFKKDSDQSWSVDLSRTRTENYLTDGINVEIRCP